MNKPNFIPHEPSYTVDEFCAAERISRVRLYEMWKLGHGPRFYMNGNRRVITHAARTFGVRSTLWRRRLSRKLWDEIEDLLEAYDGHLEIAVAHACCWSGELRLGLTNPDNAPARSMVCFSVGHPYPEDVAKRLLQDARDWLGGN